MIHTPFLKRTHLRNMAEHSHSVSRFGVVSTRDFAVSVEEVRMN
jgi:hypothetical protein